MTHPGVRVGPRMDETAAHRQHPLAGPSGSPVAGRPPAMAPGTRCTRCSAAGNATAPGRTSWPGSRPRTTPPGRSAGRSVWTPPSCARIRARRQSPLPRRGAGRPARWYHGRARRPRVNPDHLLQIQINDLDCPASWESLQITRHGRNSGIIIKCEVGKTGCSVVKNSINRSLPLNLLYIVSKVFWLSTPGRIPPNMRCARYPNYKPKRFQSHL